MIYNWILEAQTKPPGILPNSKRGEKSHNNLFSAKNNYVKCSQWGCHLIKYPIVIHGCERLANNMMNALYKIYRKDEQVKEICYLET